MASNPDTGIDGARAAFARVKRIATEMEQTAAIGALSERHKETFAKTRRLAEQKIAAALADLGTMQMPTDQSQASAMVNEQRNKEVADLTVMRGELERIPNPENVTVLPDDTADTTFGNNHSDDAYDFANLILIAQAKERPNFAPPYSLIRAEWAGEVAQVQPACSKRSVDHLNWKAMFPAIVGFLLGDKADAALQGSTRKKFLLVRDFCRLDENTGHLILLECLNSAFQLKRILRDEADQAAVFARLWSEPMFGAHRGRDSLYEKMRRFYVNLQRAELQKLMRQTEIREIKRNDHNEAKVVTPLVVTGPMEQLQMDLIDMSPFASANNGITACLVVVDCFSKFLWVFPMMDKQASTVIAHLSSLFMRYEGFPKVLQSDNGGEFTAAESRRWYESNGIIFRTSRPNKPSSNGQVERTNGTLKSAIYADFLRSGQYSFINWLDSYVMAYNTMVHTSTGYTPYELHKGRRMTWMPDKPAAVSETSMLLLDQWGIDATKLSPVEQQLLNDDNSVVALLAKQAQAIPSVILDIVNQPPANWQVEKDK